MDILYPYTTYTCVIFMQNEFGNVDKTLHLKYERTVCASKFPIVYDTTRQTRYFTRDSFLHKYISTASLW